MVEHPKCKSTQPRYPGRRRTLHLSFEKSALSIITYWLTRLRVLGTLIFTFNVINSFLLLPLPRPSPFWLAASWCRNDGFILLLCYRIGQPLWFLAFTRMNPSSQHGSLSDEELRFSFKICCVGVRFQDDCAPKMSWLAEMMRHLIVPGVELL